MRFPHDANRQDSERAPEQDICCCEKTHISYFINSTRVHFSGIVSMPFHRLDEKLLVSVRWECFNANAFCCCEHSFAREPWVTTAISSSFIHFILIKCYALITMMIVVHVLYLFIFFTWPHTNSVSSINSHLISFYSLSELHSLCKRVNNACSHRPLIFYCEERRWWLLVRCTHCVAFWAIRSRAPSP